MEDQYEKYDHEFRIKKIIRISPYSDPQEFDDLVEDPELIKSIAGFDGPEGTEYYDIEEWLIELAHTKKIQGFFFTAETPVPRIIGDQYQHIEFSWSVYYDWIMYARSLEEMDEMAQAWANEVYQEVESKLKNERTDENDIL